MTLESRIRTLASTIGTRVKSIETSLAGKAAASHSHEVGDLPVAGAGVSSTTLIPRADDPRLSDARAPTTHDHDSRYYTETESDARFAAASHTHTASAITDPSNLPGAEAGAAERTTSFTTTNTTVGATGAVITSLSVTVVGNGRDMDIEFIGVVQHTVASSMVGAYFLCDGSYTTGPAAGYLSGVSLGATGSNSARTLHMKRRVMIPAGVSRTFTVGIWTGTAGTVTVNGSATVPIQLMATRC